ncbi:MAG: DUF305 domain-containing protein [Mycolicibacterium cosmeticum]|nr:DUF305 domain-containing protein [Mycolicibacterium cosmeticum]
MRVHVSAALLAVALSLAGCSAGDQAPAATPAAGSPVSTAAPAGSNAEDTAFGTDLLPLQKQAIQLAGLAPARSSDADLVTLAKTIATGQQGETDTVKVLLVQWNDGAGPPAAPGAPAAAPVARLESLQGREFDTLWLQSMLGLHRATIDLTRAEISGGRNVDAQTLAKTILATRQAQVEQMQRMVG